MMKEDDSQWETLASLTTVTIDWREKVSTFESISNAASKLPHLDEKGFYAILGATFAESGNKPGWINYKLLYIGQAFDQTLRKRIPQGHDAYKCVNEQLEKSGKTAIVMVGFVTRCSATVTSDLFDDIECCLIHTNQPFCNTECRDEYNGRPIRITNTGGYQPLRETSSCQKPASETE
jgi:hypothetical protein